MFRELKRMMVIDYEPSVLNVRKLRESKTELSFLTLQQIDLLLNEVGKSKNNSLESVVLVCIVTGARWSEAERLTLNKCVNQGINFDDTKNGFSRFVPVDQTIYQLLQERLKHGSFKSCYSAYRSAFERTGISVPSGQLAHVLRHTFASHFIMNGGNIIALQKILGHSSLNITMRYSHLAPDYLQQAVQLNPMALKNKSGNNVES